MDITPLAPNTPLAFGDAGYLMSEPQFLGILYSEPTIFTMQNLRTIEPDGIGGLSHFTIDNVAIRTTPEPTSVLFLAVGFAALAWWRTRNVAV